MEITVNTKYSGNCKAILSWSRYIEDGSPYLVLINANTHEPVTVATSCLAAYDLRPRHGEVFIKDYSENEGLFKCLLEQGVVHPNPVRINLPPYGATFYRCKLTDEAMRDYEASIAGQQHGNPD